MTMSRRLAAEFIGTFVLVLLGCGAAVISSGFPGVGIGFLGVAFAFGLAVLTMAYAVGGISGGHFNPAVTVGLSLARRFEWRDVLPYIVTQVVAAVAAAGCLLAIAEGKPGYSLDVNGLAANGYGAHSPGHYALGAALLTEILMTAFFVFVILGATDRRAPKGFGPLAIGLALTADPPDEHPRHEHVGEPGPVDRAGLVRRGLGPEPAVVVLVGAARRSGDRRVRLPLRHRRRRRRAHRGVRAGPDHHRDLGGRARGRRPRSATFRRDRSTRTRSPVTPEGRAADAPGAAGADPPLRAAEITWWGHACVLLAMDDVQLLTDPVLVRRMGPLHYVGHLPTRDELAHVDAVLISHLHHDHLHLRSLALLPPTARLIVPLGAAQVLRGRVDRPVEELAPGRHDDRGTRDRHGDLGCARRTAPPRRPTRGDNRLRGVRNADRLLRG